MTANKVNGYGAPYRSQTFQDQANAQTARNGLLKMDGTVSQDSGVVSIPQFTFIQDGLIVDTLTVRTIPSPSLAAPYYLIVSAPTPSNLDDLIFSFAKTPLDLTTDDIIVAAWDGLEWRAPQFLSIDGIYDDIDQGNIDFGRVGPFSGLQTTLVGSNYENSPGVVVDPQGLRQNLPTTAVFPVVVTDPDYPRVDRVIYRRPDDSPNRIGLRQFELGGTYAITPASSHAATPFAATLVRNNVKTLIASDNTAVVLCSSGYGGAYTVSMTRISADRASTLLAATALGTATDIAFDAALDGSDNIHLITVVSGQIFHRVFNLAGTAVTASARIDAQVTPCAAPSVSIDPASTKVYVTYQSLLGASNNQIFFTTRNISGSQITAPKNITGTLSNLQNPSIFATDDLFAYVAWEDTTFTKIYYRTFDDIGNPIDAASSYISASVDRIGFSPLTDNAKKPQIWVADNKAVFVAFLQDKGGAIFGVSVWTEGAAFMQTLLGTTENFAAFSLYVDSTFNGVHLLLASTSAVDYAKLDGQDLAFSLNLAGTGAVAVSTVRDQWGSMYHAWTAAFVAGFQTAYQTAHIHDIGPAVVTNGPNSYSLTAFQFMIASSFFTSPAPQLGDRVVITGSLVGNNGTYTIAAAQLVTLVTANDYYLVTLSTATVTAESPAPNPVIGAFSQPNGNAVKTIKSTSDLTATAFRLLSMDTDILLARISMPGSHIVNYLPPGVTVALDASLFVPHGNNVIVDWGHTTLGNFTITGGLQLLDMLHDQNYLLTDVSLPMADDTAIYVLCDGADFTPTPIVTPVNTLPFSTPIIVLGVVRDGRFNPAQLAMAAVTQLEVGEQDVIGEDLPLTQRQRLGILTDTTYRAYGSSAVVNEAMDHAQAIGALDNEVGALMNNHPAEAYWNGTGSQTIFDIALATVIGSPFTWSTDNTNPDIIVDVDGRAERLDATGVSGFRKLSTTTFQLSTAPIGTAKPSVVRVRKEGTSYGGAAPPTSGNLWSDSVDANIVGPGEAYDLGAAAAPFRTAYLNQLAITCSSTMHVGGVGSCKNVKNKKNVSGATIAGGTFVSVYSDGAMYPGSGSILTGQSMFGITLCDVQTGFYGPVLIVSGYNIPGILTSYAFAPGTRVYVDDTGAYSDGSTGISDNDPALEFVGIADCADNAQTGTATDLIARHQHIDRVKAQEDTVLTVNGQTDYTLPSITFKTDNNILDVQLWYDTGYQQIDGSGVTGFKKTGTNTIRLSEAPSISGKTMIFRKAGLALSTEAGGGGGGGDFSEIPVSPTPDAAHAAALDLGTLARPWSAVVMKDQTTNQVWRLFVDNGVIDAVQIGTFP